MKKFIYIIFASALTAYAASFAYADTVHHEKEPADKAEQTAFGIAADPAAATRIIHIEMSDAMRFNPSKINVKRGEKVKFVIVNKGAVKHEMVLGTMAELKEHAALMKKFPNMEHDEPSMTSVEPGKTGQIAWQFNRAGEFYYACLVPGHFEAGMIGKVTVK